MKMRTLMATAAFVTIGLFSGAAFACGGGHAEKSSKSEQTQASAQKTSDKSESEETCACGKKKSACEGHHEEANKDDGSESES